MDYWTPSTLNDLVDLIEECEVGDSPYRFEGGNGEIVAEVLHEMAVTLDEIIDLDLDLDDEDNDFLACHKVINLLFLFLFKSTIYNVVHEIAVHGYACTNTWNGYIGHKLEGNRLP